MTRLDPKEREALILAAAMRVATRTHYAQVTLQQIADEAQVSKYLPTYYFGTMPNMRRKIMREAIRTRNLTIVLQGVLAKDRRALSAPPELIAAAKASL